MAQPPARPRWVLSYFLLFEFVNATGWTRYPIKPRSGRAFKMNKYLPLLFVAVQMRRERTGPGLSANENYIFAADFFSERKPVVAGLGALGFGRSGAKNCSAGRILITSAFSSQPRRAVATP